MRRASLMKEGDLSSSAEFPLRNSDLASGALNALHGIRSPLHGDGECADEAFWGNTKQLSPSSPKLWSIRMETKPLVSGGVTGGPPVSRQESFNLHSFADCQAICTVPVPFRSEPYLAAFVANSCRHIVSSNDACDGSQRSGPFATIPGACHLQKVSARESEPVEGEPHRSLHVQ